MLDETQILFFISHLILKLWSTRSSEDLLYIQHSDVSECALLWIEHFRALKNKGIIIVEEYFFLNWSQNTILTASLMQHGNFFIYNSLEW